MKKILLFLTVSLSACDKPFCEDQSDQVAGIVIRVLDDQYLAYDLKRGEDLGRSGIKISNAEQYRQVFSNCCSSRLDSVDFTKYDILGLTTLNQGSNSSYLRDVKRDDSVKKIVYTVTERYCRRASPTNGEGNFVIVPKLPVDYAIDYRRSN